MEKYLQEYIDRNPKSKEMFEKAQGHFPLGVTSNIRSYPPFPWYADRANGSKVYDIDGHELIDCQLAMCPMMTGYNNPKFTKAMTEALELGRIHWAIPHKLEIEAAECVKERYPFVDTVRFSCSGTEATMHAVRIARAHTGKDKIIKLEGGYHGAHDSLLWSIYPDPAKIGPAYAPTPVPVSTGLPSNMIDNIITIPYNNIEALENAVKKYSGQIAGFIMEPAMANISLVLPEEGYLKKVREITKRENIILIFDEVIMGCKVAYGGGVEYFGVEPDMITLSKAIGGGFPVSVVAGKKDIMMEIENGCYHAGNFGGNPLGMTAMVTTMRDILTKEATDTLIKKCDSAYEEMDSILKKSGVPHHFAHMGTIAGLLFTGEKVTDYRSMSSQDWNQWHKFYITMLNKGVIMIGCEPTEMISFSVMHTDEDFEKAIKAFKETIDTF